MSQRALVTVVRGYGDSAVSNAIITGTVAREIRMIQVQRDLLRRRQSDDIRMKIAVANERYAIKPENRIRRFFESVLGLGVLLYEWHKEAQHVSH